MYDPECIAISQQTLVPHIKAALAAYAEAPEQYRALYRVLRAMRVYPNTRIEIIAPAPEELDAAQREQRPLPSLITEAARTEAQS